MKFSHKIVMISSLLLIGTVLILSVHQLKTVQNSFNSLINNSMNELLTSMKQTVMTEMSGKKTLAKSITESIQLDPANQAYVDKMLNTARLKSTFITIGLGYQNQGELVQNDEAWDVPEDYDPRLRPWYQKVKNTGHLIVTDPYVDFKFKKIVVSIATPVFSHGQFIGGMYYDLDLSGLSDIVSSVHLLDSGHLFVVSQSGQTIAHPDENNIGKN